MKSRTGFIKVTLIVAVLLCAAVVAGSLWLRGGGQTIDVGAGAITFEVFQGEFISSVNEVGDIESSNNVEVRCKVKSGGRAGVAILDLVPEGTLVKEGEFLCQLDDSLLREEYIERKIRVAGDKAKVIQAKSMLDAAQRKLKEYEEGTYNQEMAQLAADINVAKEREKRSMETSRHSAQLNRKGYATRTQFEADVFAAQTAREELTLAEEKLRVYKDFTKDRIIAELKSAIEQEAANLEASEFTLELSEQRAADYARQIENCKVTAPQDGTVVYANDSDRAASIVIEEGETIRDGQTIFFLPDPAKMQVNAKVNDSKINKVKQGQRVEVRVDTAPETPIAGKVRKVNSFPLPRRYYQAPIEYEVFVDITEVSPLVRGGLRGKVEIFVERQEDVVQAPVSSLLVGGPDQYFVIVKTENGIEPREVEIGSNNEKFVIIKSGVEPGEIVLVDADNYRDDVKLPSSS